MRSAVSDIGKKETVRLNFISSTQIKKSNFPDRIKAPLNNLKKIRGKEERNRRGRKNITQDWRRQEKRIRGWGGWNTERKKEEKQVGTIRSHSELRALTEQVSSSFPGNIWRKNQAQRCT